MTPSAPGAPLTYATIPVDRLAAIFFDLDGTLLDTDNEVVGRLSQRLRPVLGHRSGPAARWLLMKAETPGNALVTLLDWMHLDGALMAITDRLRRRRGVYPAREFRLIPGVQEALLTLSERGYRLGIVSTRSRHHIQAFLERFPGIAAVIETSCGLQDTLRLKPHPSPILLAARRLGIPPQQCMMVGDTTADVTAARRAGAVSIGVLCGFGEHEELAEAGAHAILRSTVDLPEYLLSLRES